MRFLFRHWILILSILPLMTGCISPKKADPPNDVNLNSIEAFEKFFMENGGTFNDDYRVYMDQYGNEYELVSYLASDEYYIECAIKNIPDMKVLLASKNYIRELSIGEDSPITDITFLENFQRLRSLYIGNQNIVNFKPLAKLVSLEWLRIDNEDPIIVDCSMFANLVNLEALMLSTDRVINLETIFDKSQEEFKLPQLESVYIGEYSLKKNKPSFLLSKIEGLTPENKSGREEYGDRYENYIDQYGNKFYNLSWTEGDVSVNILGTPDIDVLLRLKNDITNLYIYESSPITDISFLNDFSKLKKLKITNPNISTLKSMNSLSKPNLISIELKVDDPDTLILKTIDSLSAPRSIDLAINKKLLTESGYTGVLDFLRSFKNRDKLNELFLVDEDINDEDEIYLLAKETFEISGIERININEKWFHRDVKKSFEFESGTYHILQYGANVRAEPNKNSKAIAVLNLHDEIEIVENTFVEEKINNVWGFWYKIKHGGVLGYTFGGNIAYKAFVTDIDKNGVKDYFYYRFSGNRYSTYIEPNKDVIIYINGQRINTNVLSNTERYFEEGRFQYCKFEEGDGYVLIGLSQYGRHDYEYLHIFKVLPDGKIEFITNWNEIDYW